MFLEQRLDVLALELAAPGFFHTSHCSFSHAASGTASVIVTGLPSIWPMTNISPALRIWLKVEVVSHCGSSSVVRLCHPQDNGLERLPADGKSLTADERRRVWDRCFIYGQTLLGCGRSRQRILL
jgi:hypothetical protein